MEYVVAIGLGFWIAVAGVAMLLRLNYEKNHETSGNSPKKEEK